MSKIINFLFALLFIPVSYIAGSTCADSVTIQYYYHHTSNSNSYSISVDTFDLDSGIVNSCYSVSPDPNNIPSFGCTASYWTKNVVTKNVNGDTTEILTLTGSLTGWQNSTRKLFTYDPLSNLRLTESQEIWNGSSWQQFALNQWIYNGSNQLIEKTEQGFNGASTINVWRYLWSYAAGVLVSRTIQNGNGNIWVNSKNYIFSYDVNGSRDSVTLQYWDTTNSIWNTIGISPYYMNVLKLADFVMVKPVTLSGFVLNDSISFSIDTLENDVYYYELKPTSASIIEDDYSLNINTYGYINGLYRIMTSHSSSWWDDHSGFGLNWYCTDDHSHFYYDSEGFIIQSTQDARCVMPQRYTTDYYYNSNHILIRETGHLDANVSEDDYTRDNFFATSDSLIIYLHPWDHLPYRICQGDSFTIRAMAAGGCGNYSFNWSPSFGLSATNVADPLITVNDSVVYTITVSDTTGLSFATQLQVYPKLQIDINVDSSACTGCPIILQANDSSFYTYQWYLNGVPIPNSDTSSILATTSGSYFVFVSSSHYCSFTSDTINLYTLSTEKINFTDFNLSPNPTSGNSKLTFSSKDNKHYKVSLINLTGEEILLYDGSTGNAGDLSLMLDASKLNSGIYVISVYSEESVRRVQWVVCR